MHSCETGLKKSIFPWALIFLFQHSNPQLVIDLGLEMYALIFWCFNPNCMDKGSDDCINSLWFSLVLWHVKSNSWTVMSNPILEQSCCMLMNVWFFNSCHFWNASKLECFSCKELICQFGFVWAWFLNLDLHLDFHVGLELHLDLGLELHLDLHYLCWIDLAKSYSGNKQNLLA